MPSSEIPESSEFPSFTQGEAQIPEGVELPNQIPEPTDSTVMGDE